MDIYSLVEKNPKETRVLEKYNTKVTPSPYLQIHPYIHPPTCPLDIHTFTLAWSFRTSGIFSMKVNVFLGGSSTQLLYSPPTLAVFSASSVFAKV
jgi:hypothetical protein